MGWNQRLKVRLWRIGPALLLLVTLMATAAVWQVTRSGNVIGFAAIEMVNVGSSEGGVIETIAVEEGQEVLAGQVVAVLDSSSLEAEIRVLYADEAMPVAVRDARVSALERRKKARVLRAPVAGRVDAVRRRSGEVVAPGESIVELIRVDATRVIACLGPNDADTVIPGDVAVLTPRSGGPELRGTAVALGASVEQKDIRCRVFATSSEWGREAYVSVPDARLVPGQIFDIRFERLADPPAGAARSVPKELDVPAILRTTRSVEPSGAVWAPERERYILVSDETGEHDPWVATADRHGRVDPEPVDVRNVKRVDDLEAITRGVDGAYWLIASQSLVPGQPLARERTMFLRTEADMRVSSKTSLREVIDVAGIGPELLPGGDLSELDIEGLAWREGSLYLGLRRPLIDGRAVIWRLDEPDLLVTEDRLSPGQLTLWGQLALTLESGQPAGVSDLLFLPDGSLVVAGGPVAGTGGALFLVRAPGPGLSEGTLVHTFGGADPEALALSPNPGRLAVFFDEGQDPAHWLELPWPR